MRKLATIDVIQEVRDIPEADKIQAYRVRNWWVVDGKGKYNPGDVIVFIEPDAWLPQSEFPFMFKEGEKVREFDGIPGKVLRTQRFRGQISQGLITPVKEHIQMELGADVSEHYGIVKYEPVEKGVLTGDGSHGWPSHLPKTDQERVQNLTYPWPKWMLETEWEVQTKLDGSSCTIYFDYDKNDAFVCSRNIVFRGDVQNSFMICAKDQGLLDFVRYHRIHTIRAELVGPGVQNNRDNWPRHHLIIYDVYNLEEKTYLNPFALNRFVYSNIDTFRSQEHRKSYVAPNIMNRINLADYTVEDLIELSIGPGMNYGSEHKGYELREGIVVKPARPFRHGESFKVINPDYLIKTKQ